MTKRFPKETVLRAARAPVVRRGGESEPHRVTAPTHDAAFLAWCESYKPCKRCKRKFYGPVCECETGS